MAVEGMSSIVATVSGYEGSERMKLIKLISSTGAHFVGKLSRSTTHLICWKFEGKKYDLAQKFGTVILNHRWLEDCIKEGKRVSEYPYTSQSGEEIGHIQLDLPVVSDTADVLSENKLLLNKTNIRDRLREVIDLDSDEIENDGWNDDWLLDENLFPKPGSSNFSTKRSKRKVAKQIYGEDSEENSDRRFSGEPRVKMLSRVQETIDEESPRTDIAGPSRRSRRLVKKNGKKSVMESAATVGERWRREFADTNELSTSTSISNKSNDLVGKREGNINKRFETAVSGVGPSEVEEVNQMNGVGPPQDTSLQVDDATDDNERILDKAGPDVEILSGELIQRKSFDYSAKSSVTAEVSCIICWTEFSSTRGVLPCGHRFCFSCIQEWANRMGASRKESVCPICKSSFASITKVEDAEPSDQKIFSQTIPNPSSTQNIFIVPEFGAGYPSAEISRPSVCYICQGQEPTDCLMQCRICQIRCVHYYCLDPPLYPWTCLSCREVRLLY